MYKVSRLPNGVTVATANMPHMASVSLGIWVGVGGRFEPEEICGVSHFIEHMLFKGTARRDAKKISQDVEGIGGYLNAFTTEENTCFYAKACHDCIEDVWDVLADMFLHSTFDPAEIEKERSVIKEELAMYKDQPHHHVQDLLNEALWPDQPLGRPLTGTEKTLDQLTRAQMLKYKEGNYVSQNTLVVFAGNIRHDAALKVVGKTCAKIKNAKRPGFLPAQASNNSPRTKLFTKKIEQTQLAFALRTCSRHDERRHALRILNAILGENMSSRLFQVVREENGLAYSIVSSLSYFDDVGAIVISAGVDTEKTERSLKLIVSELQRLARENPGASEVRRSRDYIVGQIDMSLENTENQMMWAGEHLLGYGKIIPPSEVKDRLREVTPSQVRAVARDFFNSERAAIALVSPLSNANPIEGLLRKLG